MTKLDEILNMKAHRVLYWLCYLIDKSKYENSKIKK